MPGLLAHRAVDPPPPSSLAEERTPLLTSPPCAARDSRRPHPDVLLPAGQVNGWAAADGERGNLIADRLYRPRSRGIDRLTNILQHSLDVWWKRADVVIG
jgi:hypothetical protein